MESTLRSIQILGVHPVEPTTEQFNETVEIQWGTGLAGDKLRDAEDSVRQHYGSLYLIEVRLEPSSSTVNWGDFAQRIEGKSSEDWQVAYDERAIDSGSGAWAFFLHYVDFDKPLETPLGPMKLPAPSPTPPHLADCEYFVP